MAASEPRLAYDLWSSRKSKPEQFLSGIYILGVKKQESFALDLKDL